MPIHISLIENCLFMAGIKKHFFIFLCIYVIAAINVNAFTLPTDLFKWINAARCCSSTMECSTTSPCCCEAPETPQFKDNDPNFNKTDLFGKPERSQPDRINLNPASGNCILTRSNSCGTNQFMLIKQRLSRCEHRTNRKKCLQTEQKQAQSYELPSGQSNHLFSEQAIITVNIHILHSNWRC